MATLKDVKVGESCSVARLAGTGALKRRIMDMGLTKGTRVYVRKVAPLGDPIELPFFSPRELAKANNCHHPGGI